MYFKDIFNGNEAVIERLVGSIETGAIAFTGAGTSMPAAPSWLSLISQKLKLAFNEGRISRTEYESLQNETDILYVADQVVEAIGRDQLYAKISTLFENCTLPNAVQKQLIQLPFSRFITLNYDLGLEKASTEVLSVHRSTFTPGHKTKLEKWLDASVSDVQGVLHWHGSVLQADDMVFSVSDYNRFYDLNQHNKQTLSAIFRFRSVVMIGFGFSDHFITHPLESIMRGLATDNKHFAIIGVDPEMLDEPTFRKKFATKYKLEIVLYPVAKTSDGLEDHSGLNRILHEISERVAKNPNDVQLIASHLADTKIDLELHTDNLFMVGDKKIYCEPNLISRGSHFADRQAEMSVADLAADSSHALIFSPHEYGLTTVGKRILVEDRRAGRNSHFKDATQLPNYKKKLLAEADLKAYSSGNSFTLILDNYSPIEHARLSSELLSCFPGIRLVILQRNAPSAGLDAEFIETNRFRVVELYGLRRSDIRTVAVAFLSDQSEEQVSFVVDKIYTDFIQLCIPFTPSNVIMYCSVLYREGDFSPVSRLQIGVVA